jgi:hypothetical protein
MTTGQVEAIPAQAMEFITMWCGRLNLFFMWQQALDIFLSQFVPVEHEENSTDQFSTARIYEMLSSHCGVTFPVEELVKYLTEKGYRYAYTSDLQLEWLFCRV